VSPTNASFLVWGLAALLILVLELLAWRDVVPWNTLTWTIRQTFAHFGQLAYLLFIGLIAIFTAHILYRRSKRDEPEGRR
jgi:hypothetical protein